MGRSGGGGGRSGGGFGGSFGGGRSGGSFGSAGRSGGGFSSGGFSGGSRGRSTGPSFGGGLGGGFGMPLYRPPVVYVNNSRRYGGGPTGGGPTGGPPNSGKQGSALKTILTILAVVIVIVLLIGLFSGSDVTKSTVERTPLSSGSVIETAYYTDEPGWISNKAELESGLRSFYKQTGIQPYLYIASSIPGTNDPNSADMQRYAESLYDELIEDEAHFLLVFYDYGDGNYICGYWQGAQTKAVMDSEAISILSDYISEYYYSDRSEEEFFSDSFEQTANRMMMVTKSPVPTILLSLVGLCALMIAFSWWKKAKEREAQKAKETQEILNTPLEAFGDTEVEELAKKYESNE